MDEKKVIAEFWKAANKNNEQAARNALKQLFHTTVNAQDDDGYTMLITAVQNGNLCAIRALLDSGQCNLDLRENLCGMTAGDFSEDYPENSPIRQEFCRIGIKKVRDMHV